MQETFEVVLVLHNVRSAHNVGSILRTADAVGVSRVFFTGYTPAPLDRFGRVQKGVAKTALGAESAVPWEKRASLSALVGSLKKKGFSIVALEQGPRAVDYRTFRPHFPVALILGNEVRGIDARSLRLCDTVVEIPMRGAKESLNVSVAAGVLLSRVLG